MRVVTIKRFKDFQAGVIREPGEFFECSEERFAEIDAKLPGFVVCIEPDKPAEQEEGGQQTEVSQEGATEPDKPGEATAGEQPAQADTKKAQSSKRASSK